MTTFVTNLALELLANGADIAQHNEIEQESQSEAGTVSERIASLAEAQYVDKHRHKRKFELLIEQFNNEPTFKKVRRAHLINGKAHTWGSYDVYTVPTGLAEAGRKRPQRRYCLLCKAQVVTYCKWCKVTLCTRAPTGIAEACWNRFHVNQRIETKY